MSPPLLAPTIEDSEFVVVSHTWVTPAIVEIELKPVDQRLGFLPGQYVLVSDTSHELPMGSYSIANSPQQDGYITLLVTHITDGRMSKWLTSELGVDDTVLVSGPYGTFVRDDSNQLPVLCLAGGSGLAPIRALAQSAVDGSLDVPFLIVFSVRTEDDVINGDLFESWAATHDNFHFVRTLTRSAGEPPLGRVPEVLRILFSDLAEYEVFIAGSPGFVRTSAVAARKLGVLSQNLHTEEFFAEPSPWTQTTMKGN